MENEKLRVSGDRETKKQLEAELERFVHTLSHDLQQPLSKVITISEMLLARLKNIDEVDRDYLERMHNAGQHMRSLIEEMSRSQISDLKPLIWPTQKK